MPNDLGNSLARGQVNTASRVAVLAVHAALGLLPMLAGSQHADPSRPQRRHAACRAHQNDD